jgi:hypothetical protein
MQIFLTKVNQERENFDFLLYNFLDRQNLKINVTGALEPQIAGGHLILIGNWLALLL